MFESKKSQILIAHQKKGLEWTQKCFLAGKKYPQGLKDFARVFGKLTVPYGMFENKKSQIPIAHQKEGIDRTQESVLAGKKSTPRF